jgi:flagellar motor switch protein FliM
MTGTPTSASETAEAVPPSSAPKEGEAAAVAATSSKRLGEGGLLSQAASRKLRSQQEEFARCLEARLSVNFRLDFSFRLAGVQMISFQKFVELAGTPLHFTLFKLDPLRGIALLEIPPALGLNIVNRLLGGPGQLENAARALTDIETALLDQVANVILAEWATAWSVVQELKPTTVGHEIDARFLNAISRETLMLELTFEATLGESRERFRIGLPYASFEPLIRRLTNEVHSKDGGPAVVLTASPHWNPQLDDVPVKLTAVCRGLDLKVQALATLKVGDILPVDAQQFQAVEIHLGTVAKFVGLLGTSEGRWGVQLTRKLEA